MKENDPFARLRGFTPARIGLGRCGNALPTQALLEFQLAHARARDAVHETFSPGTLATQLSTAHPGAAAALIVHSQAPDRHSYLQRPDLGRSLDVSDSEQLVTGQYEVAFVIADGLSAPAAHRHAVPLLQALWPKLEHWRIAPVIIACQARVALGDEIGARLGAALVAMLIGERPGLTSPDSLGVYLTWQPRIGRQDSERNCISNIRPPTGLSYDHAASRLAWLMQAARHQRLTGVGLKDSSNVLAPPAG
jgi:ethanolamine ammonia-lyase small subunit